MMSLEPEHVHTSLGIIHTPQFLGKGFSHLRRGGEGTVVGAPCTAVFRNTFLLRALFDDCALARRSLMILTLPQRKRCELSISSLPPYPKKSKRVDDLRGGDGDDDEDKDHNRSVRTLKHTTSIIRRGDAISARKHPSGLYLRVGEKIIVDRHREHRPSTNEKAGPEETITSLGECYTI